MMNLFARLTKVDEAKQLVYGRAADESVDKADEAMDYAGSKPHFLKWSEDIAKDTDGKSLGNVRAMHGKVAAGKLTAIDFDDSAKTIDVCAKIVDQNEWNKVLQGVYTGFSIGGSYGAKTVEKIDDKSVTRYIAMPNEISLVDRPCIPSAKFFEVQKADGTLTEVDFQVPQPADVEVNGTPDQVEELGKIMLEKKLSLSDVIALAKGESTQSDDEYLKAIHDKLAAGEAITDEEKAMLDKAYDHYKGSECMSKGDFDGHPFRGNQYAAGTSGDAVNKSMKAHGKESKGSHSAAARAHVAAAKKAGNRDRTRSYHEQMAAFHSSRAGAAKMDDADFDDALTKLEDSLAEFGELNKIAARNNDADKPRIEAIAKAVAEFGIVVPAIEKVTPAGDLVKADTLAKMIADAVAPMQKALDDAATKIAALEAQPAVPRVSLRAVAKSQDTGSNDPAPTVTEADLVKDATGAIHPAASLIKQALQQGGQPLHYHG